MRYKPYIIYNILLLGLLLGIHDGKIALWKGDDPQPRLILPYSASALPPKDRADLAKGIAIRNEEELIRLIEDFCS